ncbi:hypothetical protein GCM10007860_05420 [Chitiniphilus shinanonensis]|uniref:Flagellar protein FliT n=1 Tax=Chitiniphilus shinanonensis TaxID=553088 RepID=A0ABQ6BUB7_9NEIS|nr:flagellar protein FliT [Chitiniphilus shinanonensis]GLS03399.1 hypothetical protein GCM10007860_05420 [Chitiniphilus shinanonensis]
MEELDVTQLLTAFNLLTHRMLGEARNARWEEMLGNQEAWNTLQDELRDIHWENYSPEQREVLRTLLLDTQQAIDELTALCTAWRPQLAAMLNGLHNSSKLRNAYRV